MIATPSFWYQRSITGYIIMILLWPLSLLWRLASAIRRLWIKPAKLSLPVICIGNLTAGGTGKTPLVTCFAEAAIDKGLTPVILSKGYGGSASGPHLVTADDSAAMVGDEPLELAAICPVVIAKNRKVGALWIAKNMTADVILMDDGFQNPGLRPDIGIVVFDGNRGIGNGQIMPVGPMREGMRNGLKRASYVVIIGDDKQGLTQSITQTIQRLRTDIPIISASKQFYPSAQAILTKEPLLAFAGIGHPDAFFALITQYGGQLIKTLSFPDHHRYTATEWQNIHTTALRHKAKLVTTRKDYMRLDQDQRRAVTPLPLTLDLDQRWIDAIYDELRHG